MKSLSIRLGGGIILFYIMIAFLAPYLSPYDPTAPNPDERYQPPTLKHLMGTDQVGFDIFSRVMYGTRIDLLIALSSVMLAMVMGIPLGAISGYLGGMIDWIIMRLLEMIQAFPALILAMAIVLVLGQGLMNVIIVIAFISFPYYVRLVRAEMLTRKQLPFVEAARAVGTPTFRLIFRHLLPNCLNPVIAYASINAAWAILIAAGLGFLGLGMRIPIPEWGLMISMGTSTIVTGQWWVSSFPGLAIVILTSGFYLLGDGLNDLLDPRLRKIQKISQKPDRLDVAPLPSG